MNLHLKSVNNNPEVEYRAIAGHPVPYTITVQRRSRLPVPDAPWSEWAAVTVGDLRQANRVDGPVWQWLLKCCDNRLDLRAWAHMDLGSPAYVPLREPTTKEL
jgi:hypothetical protein